MSTQTCTITNGEEPVMPKSGPKYAEVGEDGCFQINGAQNKEGANGQLNDYDEVAISSVPYSCSGHKGMVLMSDSRRESLSSVGPVGYIAPERDHVGQDSVNNDNLTGHLYGDSKRMWKKKEIHDLCCPTCNLYFTKRVTLPRKAISPDFEDTVILKIPTPAFRDGESSFDCTTYISYFKTALFIGEVRVPMPEVTGPLPDIQESLLVHQRESPRQEDSRVDIVKAIVYGGLLESIASLSIIVSAAGGDATTLNVVALGLANVFGGLLVLANNLTTLKELTGQQYEDQLGQPRHFLIHALIAVISYFVFGLLSPLIYGISFYKSDDKYLKLATLSAASLVFITVLSIGKAYVQRPPKKYLQTMLYYISLAITVSGIAYVAGDLISILLKKFQVFELETSISLPVLEAQAIQGPWSPY
ncbi:hypothetical protein vseg_001058 [Gypsophila vaccaria]